MTTWMQKAAVIMALIVFLSVHGVAAYLVIIGRLDAPAYMAAWASLASALAGGVVGWMGSAASKSTTGG